MSGQDAMERAREIDPVTGIETTGHEWDGLKELNKPLPKWWLLTFYATIIWSVGFWVAYPAWPTLNDYTRGVLGYSQRATVAAEINESQQAQAKYRAGIETTPLVQIRDNPELLRFGMHGGAIAFQNNCAACHGRNAQGFPGYPNLADDDWLWGGTIDDIYKTILYGVRSEHKNTRFSQMPRYGLDKLMEPDEIGAVADYVLSLSTKTGDPDQIARGAKIFADQCASCHGEGGKGLIEQGSPNLTDGIWLFGNTREAVIESIRTGRGGQMPHWQGRLDTPTLKMLAVYVHSIGGGQK